MIGALSLWSQWQPPVVQGVETGVDLDRIQSFLQKIQLEPEGGSLGSNPVPAINKASNTSEDNPASEAIPAPKETLTANIRQAPLQAEAPSPVSAAPQNSRNRSLSTDTRGKGNGKGFGAGDGVGNGSGTSQGIQVRGRGILPESMIRRALAKKAKALQRCYQRELNSSTNKAGEILLRWVVLRSGEVRSPAVIRSEFQSPRLHNCVLNQISQLEFPVIKGGSAQVIYPLIFSKIIY